ncbi:MAG: DUF4190 domain-containing protein [Lachnospiraceae bacterium]|nr:DUF4190 domain-containing protein [Lachnospiraceae bacterium]
MKDNYEWPSEADKKRERAGNSNSAQSRPKRKTSDPKEDETTVKPYQNPGRVLPGEEEPDSAIGVTSLVFGIIALLSSFALFGIGFAIAGLVMAILVLRKRYFGRGFAIAGLVTSIIALVTPIVATVLIIVFWDDILYTVEDRLVDGVVEEMFGGTLEDYLYETINDTVGQFTDGLSESLEQYVDEHADEYTDEYEDDLNDLVDRLTDEYGDEGEEE